MLKTLKESASYLGLSEPSFRHIFYNRNQKQKPTPTYLGEDLEVMQNRGGVDKKIKRTTYLRFSEDDLNRYMESQRRVS